MNSTTGRIDNTTRKLSSNVSYSKTFPGTPFSLGANLRVNQDLTTKQIDLPFPDMNFNVNNLYPFRKVKGSMVLQNFSTRLTTTATNQITNNLGRIGSNPAVDSIAPFNFQTIPTLFNNAKKGVKMNMPFQTSMKMLRYFNLSTSFTVDEVLYFKKLNWGVDPTGKTVVVTDTLNGFNTLLILDNEYCKPFDENRNGLNLGEGAGYVVLVSEKVAAGLKDKLYCGLSGYSNANDAYHQTASSPEGRGSFEAMTAALKMSGLSPEAVDYINLHGTGTISNDVSEGTAVKRLFGELFLSVCSVNMSLHFSSLERQWAMIYSILSVSWLGISNHDSINDRKLLSFANAGTSFLTDPSVPNLGIYIIYVINFRMVFRCSYSRHYIFHCDCPTIILLGNSTMGCRQIREILFLGNESFWC